jgi:hypothetical protein
MYNLLIAVFLKPTETNQVSVTLYKRQKITKHYRLLLIICSGIVRRDALVCSENLNPFTVSCEHAMSL